MRPRALPVVAAQTVAVARSALRRGALAMRVCDGLDEVFADEAFVDAFRVRGRSGICPAQLALVTVLQFAENRNPRPTPPTRTAVPAPRMSPRAAVD
jgi:hypothetical protein